MPRYSVKVKGVSTTTPNLKPCRKCDGKGYLSHFIHVDFGRCFACDGAGQVDHVARRAAATRLKECRRIAEQLPTEEQVRVALLAADPNLRRMQARHLAAAWRNVELAAVWSEPIDDDDVLELHGFAYEILVRAA